VINKKHKISPFVTSAISLALVTIIPSSLHAEDNREQCAGVVKAGSNDCASVEHICAGMNSDDGNDTDWLWLPAGTCNKIVGAHTLKKVTKSTESKESPKKS
jgi:uncharacterized membrane protein